MKESQMPREAYVIHALIEMADTLVEDFDVIDILTGLTDRCVKVLGVSAAGVMLMAPDDRELRLVASSNETMRVLELFELQAQEGPCLDAYRTGRPVEHELLRSASGRWPAIAGVALEAGFQSVVALPLQLRAATIGALNLFSVGRVPIDERDVTVARGFADLATISVLQHRAATEAQRLNEQLSAALQSRIVIEQAKGLISARTGLNMAEAYSRLHRYARNSQLRLTDVAQSAVDGTLDQSAWTAISLSDSS
jgi:GAF domain-containing protein